MRLFDGKPVSVPAREDLTFDTEALRDAVQVHDPALTVLATPNNPTGQAMPLDEIEAVVEAASGFVVVDEAYVEFNSEPSALRLLDTHPNVIILRTFSKAFGLAGLRVGFLLARPEVVGELMKSRLPFMVDAFAEEVALAALRRPELLAERVETLQASCRELTEALRAMKGVEVVPSKANFVLFRPEGGDAGGVMDRLVERGVLVRDMSGYAALQGYLRVNAGTSEENKAFLAALEHALRTEASA